MCLFYVDNVQSFQSASIKWRLVSNGLVLRVEALIRNELWRKVCVDSKYGKMYPHSLTFSKLNFTECRSHDTEPNDTSTIDVVIVTLNYNSYMLEPVKVQLATGCSEFAEFTDVNVYCFGK